MVAPFVMSTVERIMERDPALRDADAADQAVLGDMLLAVSAYVANHLRRTILSGAQTETLNVEAGNQAFLLRAFPIDTGETITVNNDVLRTFTSATELASTLFTVDADAGILYVDRTELVPGRQVLRVTYTGGMAEDTEAFVESFPDIADVVDAEVNRVWKERGPHSGLQVKSTGGGSVTRWGPQNGLLAVHEAKLAPYVRPWQL